jgi:Raf kinase inhibitor-like YbhB/YbcL family protein
LLALAVSLSGCAPQRPADLRMFEVPAVPSSLKVEINHLDEGVIPKSYAAVACNGENQSLALRWSGAPADTRSYAIVVFDADVQASNTYVHWAVIDIPASTTSIGSGESTAMTGGAVQLTQDGGKREYVGPCPPAGEKHRYYAVVYAVGVRSLQLPPASTAARLREVLATKALAYGRASGLFSQ